MPEKPPKKGPFQSKFLKNNLPNIICGIILLVLFYTFSFFVKLDYFTRFDFDMTVKIQDNIPIRFDPYFSWFSLLGSFEITLVMLMISVILMRKLGGFIVLFMFGLMHAVELIGKMFLDHPGTPFMFHRYAFDFVFPTGYVQPGGSYPSGHSMRAAFLAIFFFYIFWKLKLPKLIKAGILSAIVGAYGVMAVSRVSLGEHWTTDVIGGSLLGAAFAFLSIIFI